MTIIYNIILVLKEKIKFWPPNRRSSKLKVYLDFLYRVETNINYKSSNSKTKNSNLMTY